MNQLPLRDTIAQINLDNIAFNMRQIRTLVGEKVSIAAVVKANAYGHGAKAIAPVLMDNGAALLAVATLPEAIELKEAYPRYPVLLMGLTPDAYLSYVVSLNIIQTIDTYEQAVVLNSLAGEQGKQAVVHIKYDTGFHRIGFPDNPESLEMIKQIFKLPNLIVEGIYSHLALVNEEENLLQYKRLTNAISILADAGCTFRYQHIADSIATVDFPQHHMNLVRIGALIYGLKGFHIGELPLKQALCFKTKISHITHIKKGEGIGYDYLWKAPKDTRIATLPFGYADGYPRNLRGKGFVTIHGKKAPVVGVICMDQCMADLTGIPEAQIGDEVIIYGDGTNGTLSIDDISKLAETNKNEIVARISSRPPRVYIPERTLL